MTYRVTYHEDSEGRSILRYSGDVQGLVDACAKEAADNRHNRKPISTRTSNMRRTISLDPVVMMDICHKHGIPYDDLEAIFAVAKDRDYSRFRCVDDKTLFRKAAPKLIVV